jgi:hypothetical protein
MKIEKASGELTKQALTSKQKKNHDPEQGESLYINFNMTKYSQIADLERLDVERFFTGHSTSWNLGKGSSIMKGTFNISFGDFEFLGQKFSSATIGMVKKVGAIIKLHITLPFSEELHAWIPGNINKMIPISIIEVNEQMEVEQPDNK